MKHFDPTSKDIIVINYPPGGFGNFLYHLFSEFANETVKVNNRFEFSKTGNSHATWKYTQTYRAQYPYYPVIDHNANADGKKILVLCDNGLENPELDNVINTFPNAQIIRVVPNDSSRYLLMQTCTEKAAVKVLHDLSYDPLIAIWDRSVLGPKIDLWTSIEHSNVHNLMLTALVLDPVKEFERLCSKLGLTVFNQDNLELFCNEWAEQNRRYIEPFKEYYDRSKNS
jgi:hypothetical protein